MDRWGNFGWWVTSPPIPVVNVESVMSPSQTRSAPNNCPHRRLSDAYCRRRHSLLGNRLGLKGSRRQLVVLLCAVVPRLRPDLDRRRIRRPGSRFRHRLPPSERPPSTLMVWQVAVDDSMRGHGIAVDAASPLRSREPSRDGGDAHHDQPRQHSVATAVRVGGQARGLRFERRDLFAANAFPDSHEPEDLYMLEPEIPPSRRARA